MFVRNPDIYPISNENVKIRSVYHAEKLLNETLYKTLYKLSLFKGKTKDHFKKSL